MARGSEAIGLPSSSVPSAKKSQCTAASGTAATSVQQNQTSTGPSDASQLKGVATSATRSGLLRPTSLPQMAVLFWLMRAFCKRFRDQRPETPEQPLPDRTGFLPSVRCIRGTCSWSADTSSTAQATRGYSACVPGCALADEGVTTQPRELTSAASRLSDLFIIAAVTGCSAALDVCVAFSSAAVARGRPTPPCPGPSRAQQTSRRTVMSSVCR